MFLATFCYFFVILSPLILPFFPTLRRHFSIPWVFTFHHTQNVDFCLKRQIFTSLCFRHFLQKKFFLQIYNIFLSQAPFLGFSRKHPIDFTKKLWYNQVVRFSVFSHISMLFISLFTFAPAKSIFSSSASPAKLFINQNNSQLTIFYERSRYYDKTITADSKKNLPIKEGAKPPPDRQSGLYPQWF